MSAAVDILLDHWNSKITEKFKGKCQFFAPSWKVSDHTQTPEQAHY
jgi:hypothetical protein